MDHGTENSVVGAVQYAMRVDGHDAFSGERSIRYGTSPANIVCHDIMIINDQFIFRLEN